MGLSRVLAVGWDEGHRPNVWSASFGLRASRSADEDVEADRIDPGRGFATSPPDRADPRHGRAVGKAFVAPRTDQAAHCKAGKGALNFVGAWRTLARAAR